MTRLKAVVCDMGNPWVVFTGIFMGTDTGMYVGYGYVFRIHNT